ncbi:coiled-coil domain-containing protein 122 [Rhinophrynus dorsalis]
MSDNTPSLTKVVKQVAQQHQTQVSEMEKSRKVLIQFQTKLYEVETELKSVLLETKAVEKNIHHEEDTAENLMHLCGILENQNLSIYADSIKLKLNLESQKEGFEAIVSRNNAYRERIADNIRRFSEAENKLPVMIELIKKRDTVKNLKQKKEEMIQDLHNPDSSVIKQVQVCVKSHIDKVKDLGRFLETETPTVMFQNDIQVRWDLQQKVRWDLQQKVIQEEIVYLGEKMKEIKLSITVKNKIHDEEIEKHAVLHKEIEVQKRRYDAILKRLHCQLNKAQQNRRQYQWNIKQMEKTANDLRERLGIKK